MECVLCQTTRCCPEHCCAWGDCECGDCDQCGGDQPWKISSDDEFVTIENESQPLQEVTPGSDEPLSDGGDPSCSAAPPHTKARTCDKVKKACRGAHLLSHDSSHSAVAASLDKWREGWEERERKTARLEQEEEDRLRRLQKAAQCKQDSSRHFPTLIHSLCEQGGDVRALQALFEGMNELVAADRDERLAKALCICCTHGRVKMVGALVDMGADLEVNAEAEYEDTPMQIAIGNGHLSLVEYLVSRGAETECVRKEMALDVDVHREEGDDGHGAAVQGSMLRGEWHFGLLCLQNRFESLVCVSLSFMSTGAGGYSSSSSSSSAGQPALLVAQYASPLQEMLSLSDNAELHLHQYFQRRLARTYSLHPRNRRVLHLKASAADVGSDSDSDGSFVVINPSGDHKGGEADKRVVRTQANKSLSMALQCCDNSLRPLPPLPSSTSLSAAGEKAKEKKTAVAVKVSGGSSTDFDRELLHRNQKTKAGGGSDSGDNLESLASLPDAGFKMITSSYTEKAAAGSLLAVYVPLDINQSLSEDDDDCENYDSYGNDKHACTEDKSNVDGFGDEDIDGFCFSAVHVHMDMENADFGPRCRPVPSTATYDGNGHKDQDNGDNDNHGNGRIGNTDNNDNGNERKRVRKEEEIRENNPFARHMKMAEEAAAALQTTDDTSTDMETGVNTESSSSLSAFSSLSSSSASSALQTMLRELDGNNQDNDLASMLSQLTQPTPALQKPVGLSSSMPSSSLHSSSSSSFCQDSQLPLPTRKRQESSILSYLLKSKSKYDIQIPDRVASVSPSESQPRVHPRAQAPPSSASPSASVSAPAAAAASTSDSSLASASSARARRPSYQELRCQLYSNSSRMTRSGTKTSSVKQTEKQREKQTQKQAQKQTQKQTQKEGVALKGRDPALCIPPSSALSSSTLSSISPSSPLSSAFTTMLSELSFDSAMQTSIPLHIEPTLAACDVNMKKRVRVDDGEGRTKSSTGSRNDIAVSELATAGDPNTESSSSLSAFSSLSSSSASSALQTMLRELEGNNQDNDLASMLSQLSQPTPATSSSLSSAASAPAIAARKQPTQRARKQHRVVSEPASSPVVTKYIVPSAAVLSSNMPTAGNLLEGDFDEQESRNSFQEARLAWLAATNLSPANTHPSTNTSSLTDVVASHNDDRAEASSEVKVAGSASEEKERRPQPQEQSRARVQGQRRFIYPSPSVLMTLPDAAFGSDSLLYGGEFNEGSSAASFVKAREAWLAQNTDLAE